MLTDVAHGPDHLHPARLPVAPGAGRPHLARRAGGARRRAPRVCGAVAASRPFTAYTTAELSMNYVRPPAVDGSDLIGDRQPHPRRPVPGPVRRGDRGRSAGRLIAHGTSRCVVFEPMGPPPPEPPSPDEPVELPEYDTPDPYERRPGRGLRDPPGHLGRALGPGDPPDDDRGRDRPPAAHAISPACACAEAGEDTTTFVMPAHEHLCSPLKTIQGGTIAMLADTAMMCAVQTTTRPRTVDVPGGPQGRTSCGRCSRTAETSRRWPDPAPGQERRGLAGRDHQRRGQARRPGDGDRDDPRRRPVAPRAGAGRRARAEDPDAE